MKLFHAQLILCKLIDTLEGGGGALSAFHRVITLTFSKVGRRRERGTKELGMHWGRKSGVVTEMVGKERKGKEEEDRRREEKHDALLTFTLLLSFPSSDIKQAPIILFTQIPNPRVFLIVNWSS